MRILHIISNMRPEAGGPQEAVRMLLRYAPAGYECEVVTLDDPDADFLQSDSSSIHTLGSVRKLIPWLRVNRNRFDGVILHGMWESLSFSVLRAIAGHIPYMVYPHGMLDPYFKREFPLKHLKKWLYWVPVQYWVMRRAFRVVFTTEAERDLATRSFRLHRWNSMVVGLGAEAPPQDLARCREAFFAACPEVRSHRFLLFLGRINRKKGCDLLIPALAASTVADPSLHLVMAGPDGSGWASDLKAAAAKAGVADRIHWPGMLKGDAKWGAFTASEAFVLPSHQENFGIAVVEALACAKPVLITKPINIAPDIALDGSGFVEDDTLSGVKMLFNRWIALSATERKQMSQRAQESYTTRFDMLRNTATLLQTFATVTSKQPAAVAEVTQV